MPPCSRSTTRTRSIRSASTRPATTRAWRGCASGPSTGSSARRARRPPLRAGGRDRDAPPRTRARRRRRAGAELWRRIGRAHALRHDGDAFLEAMNAHPAEPGPRNRRPSSTPTSRSRRRCGPACGAAGRARARRRLDRPGARARRAGQRHPRPGADRPLRLGTAGLRRRGTRGEPDRGAAGRSELRSYAWDARGITIWVAGEPDLGRAFEERRFELLDQIHDPDHVADIHYAPVTGCVWLGYFDEARRLADRHDEIVATLRRTTGSTGSRCRRSSRSWSAAGTRSAASTTERDGRPRQPRHAVHAQPADPARLRAGGASPRRSRASRRARGARGRLPGLGLRPHARDAAHPHRARPRRARGGGPARCEPLPDRGWHRAWLLLSTQAARLDALAALGRRDEVEAWPAPRRGTYLEPFLLRSLGVVRADASQIARAAEAFERLRLGSQAEETRALLEENGA